MPKGVRQPTCLFAVVGPNGKWHGFGAGPQEDPLRPWRAVAGALPEVAAGLDRIRRYDWSVKIVAKDMDRRVAIRTARKIRGNESHGRSGGGVKCAVVRPEGEVVVYPTCEEAAKGVGISRYWLRDASFDYFLCKRCAVFVQNSRRARETAALVGLDATK